MKRSGLLLIFFGLLGVLFFWLSDPTIGLAIRWTDRKMLIDAAQDAIVPTWVGIIGSLLVVSSGVWLMTRRTN
jgi:hypothetical protein